MFRIAAGEELGYDDPEVAGHSIEFRINAEDAGRNFMPAPGTLTRWHAAVRSRASALDGGYDQGETVPGAFDSLVAKLIVTGRDRTQALERSRRALDEFVVDGMPTVIPFHRAVVRDPAFVGDGERLRGLHPVDRDRVRQPDPAVRRRDARPSRPGERQAVTVEVGGRRLEVVLPAGFAAGAAAGGRPQKKPKREKKKAGAAASGDAVTSPMQGTIVKVAVEEGQEVAEGDVIVVLEAMKMEQPLKAHKAGTVTGLQAEVGDSVTSGAVVCELKD